MQRATALMHSADLRSREQPFFAAGVREPGQKEAAEVMKDASEFLADTTTARITVAEYQGLQSQGGSESGRATLPPDDRAGATPADTVDD